MADAISTQYDEVVRLSSALTNGTLTPEEVRIASARLPYVDALTLEFRDQLEAANTPEELARTLETILARAGRELTRLPALGDQNIEPLPTDEIAAIAKGHEAVRRQAATIKKEAASSMRSLIEKSVARYAGADAATIVDRLSATALAAAEEARSPGEAAALVQRAVEREIPQQPDAVRQILEAPEFGASLVQARAEKISREVLVENPFAPNAESIVTSSRLVSAAVVSRETAKQIIERDMRADQVLTTPAAPTAANDWGDITAGGGFFRSLPNQNVLQKAFAPAVDVALSVFPRSTREAVVSSVLSGSLERGIEGLTRKLGAAAFTSPQFSVGKAFVSAEDQKAAATGALSGISKLFGDTVGAVFRKPMDEATISYLTAIHEKAIGVASWQQTYAYHMYPAHPHMFHLEFVRDIGGWAVRAGARRAGGVLLKTAAGKAVSAGVKRGAAALAAKLGFSALAGVLTAGASIPLQIAAWLGGGTIGRIWGGIKSFLAGLVGATGTDQRRLDLAIAGLLAVVVLAPMLLFSVGDVSRTAPLATSVGGGPPPGPFVDCAREPDAPVCQYEACPDCEWPTAGYITQGPRTCSGTSHGGSNSIDIGANYQTPVYSVTAGSVAARSTVPCADTPAGRSTTGGCNSGYGNWIDIRTPEGYTLRYAHLAIGSIPLSVGAAVPKGTQVGRADNNGNSSGHHLHFEVRSGPNITSFLPADWVAKNASQLEGCERSVCGKACPSL
jgi:hypothetical protein